MPRVRKGAARTRARRRILRSARGYWGTKHRHKQQAKVALTRAGPRLAAALALLAVALFPYLQLVENGGRYTKRNEDMRSTTRIVVEHRSPDDVIGFTPPGTTRSDTTMAARHRGSRVSDRSTTRISRARRGISLGSSTPSIPTGDCGWCFHGIGEATGTPT